MRAKLKIYRLLLLTAVLASSGSARAGNCPPKLHKYCDDGQQQILPVRIYRNFMVVAEGQFGPSSESQNFILDTGTAPSVINVRLLSKLGSATLTSTFRALGKTVPSQAAVIPEIDLGPIRAVSLPAQVQDLSRLERDLGIPIAGVIGLDVLSMSSFHLDYDKSEIKFGDVSRLGIPVHFDARSGLAVAETSIQGKQARILVDTGSERLVLFGGNFAEVGWLALRNTSQTGASQIDQKIHVQVFSAANIVLGGQHFSVDKAYFVAGSADPSFDGLLGVRALGFRSLSYDRATETIYLQKLQ